jgi:hypothetical protein
MRGQHNLMGQLSLRLLTVTNCKCKYACFTVLGLLYMSLPPLAYVKYS